MVTLNRAAYQKIERTNEWACLSTDAYTDIENFLGILNGDELTLIDTGAKYLFNADTQTWVQQPVSGGGGGTSGVASFNGRTGAVVPVPTDYPPSLIGAVNKAGDTMTVDLNMDGHTVTGISDALEDTDALPKGQADDIYVNVTGDTMTGPLNMGNNKITMGGTPTEITDVTNKGYVDGVVKVVSDEVDGILTGTTPVAVPVATDAHVGGIKVGAGLSVTGDGTLSVTQSQETGITQEEADARYVQLSGANMTGNLSMGNNQVKNVADATEDSDAVSKHQMDEAIASAVPSAMLASLPDQFMEGIYNVTRTATTNTAEIRLFKKQEDGTYSSSEEHGVITLIGAGHGVDGINGAGLMTYADKQKLDSLPAPSAENNGKIPVVENGVYVFKTLAELQGV